MRFRPNVDLTETPESLLREEPGCAEASDPPEHGDEVGHEGDVPRMRAAICSGVDHAFSLYAGPRAARFARRSQAGCAGLSE
jgi:hypothetical protein